MTKRSAVVLALAVFSACAPKLHLVREEAPLVTFRPEEQPVKVAPQESGFAALELATLFTDEHARDLAASEAVAEAMKRGGQVTVSNGCEGECPNPLSTLAVTVTGLKLAGVLGTDRTAVVRMVVSREKDSWEIAGTATQGVDDAALVASAMATAGEVFAAKLQPNERLDVFEVQVGDGLAEGNQRLREGDLAGAEAGYRKRLEQRPNDVKAHLNLSAVLSAKGDFAGAAAAARRAAELDASREDAAREAEARAEKSLRVVSWGTGGAPRRPLKVWPEATVPAVAR